ncbi:ATP-binding protein [Chloroflexota bacterium]
MPSIDTAKCNGCGLCISVCPGNALVLVDNTINFIETEECDWCIQCEIVCPFGAIAFPFEIVIE